MNYHRNSSVGELHQNLRDFVVGDFETKYSGCDLFRFQKTERLGRCSGRAHDAPSQVFKADIRRMAALMTNVTKCHGSVRWNGAADLVPCVACSCDWCALMSALPV